MQLVHLRLVFLTSWFFLCAAWDSEQLEVFDVVDEVKGNFYSFLNVSQDATNQQIKTAFRVLSLKLHPDKNKERDTSIEFRNLVSVYETLKSPTKRKYYDEVLVNGLPNWRSAVYYYRYVRKMGMTEVCIILFVIITISQYLINWAAYLERKYTIEQNKKVKKRKSEPEIILPKPSILDTLPIQIPKILWFIIVSIPTIVGSIKTTIHDIHVRAPVEEVIEPVPKVKTVKKRNKFIPPEGANFETTFAVHNIEQENTPSAPVNTCGGLWTDDDLAELVKLVKKYPGGISGRWELIAETMSRTVAEVTYMANKLKDNCYKLPSEEEEIIAPIKVKVKTKKADEIEDQVKKWSQTQQKALEDALAKYPKGSMDRWDKIADLVSNKTKEECMARFKFLAETLKKQKTQ